MQIPENSFETAISHMVFNDLQKRDSNIDVVTKNIMKIANESKAYGIKIILVSGFTINNRLPSDFINAMNNALK